MKPERNCDKCHDHGCQYCPELKEPMKVIWADLGQMWFKRAKASLNFKTQRHEYILTTAIKDLPEDTLAELGFMRIPEIIK